jgi:hypothetical protein
MQVTVFHRLSSIINQGMYAWVRFLINLCWYINEIFYYVRYPEKESPYHRKCCNSHHCNTQKTFCDNFLTASLIDNLIRTNLRWAILEWNSQKRKYSNIVLFDVMWCWNRLKIAIADNSIRLTVWSLPDLTYHELSYDPFERYNENAVCIEFCRVIYYSMTNDFSLAIFDRITGNELLLYDSHLSKLCARYGL